MSYKRGSGNYKTDNVYRVRTLATLTRNNTTTFVDSELVTKTLKVGKSYYIHGVVGVNSGITPTCHMYAKVTDLVATITKWAINDLILVNAFSTGLEIPTGTGVDETDTFHLVVLDVTTAGIINMNFAQKVQDASDTKLYKGSFMMVEEF